MQSEWLKTWLKREQNLSTDYVGPSKRGSSVTQRPRCNKKIELGSYLINCRIMFKFCMDQRHRLTLESSS